MWFVRLVCFSMSIALCTSIFAVEKKKIVVGFANASEDPKNTWRIFMVANYKAELDLHKNEIKKSYYYDAENKPYLQKQQLRELLNKKIDVLIISAAHETEVNEEIEMFHKANIPVIAFDRGVSSDKITSFLSPSNLTMGASQAEWLAKKLNYKGNVVMFSGVKGVLAAEDRMRGARKVFLKYPEMKVLAAAFTSWRLDLSREEMKKMVKQFSKIDGIWSCSGAASWPALEVLAEAKRSYIPSTGDQLNGYAKFLVNNNLEGYIYPFPSSISRDALKLAIKVAQGEKVERNYDIPVEAYDSVKIKKMVRMDKPDGWWIGDDRMPQNFLPAIK